MQVFPVVVERMVRPGASGKRRLGVRDDPCDPFLHARPVPGRRRQRLVRGGVVVHVPTPASRKARFSFSISRAITSRWIWFVPS